MGVGETEQSTDSYKLTSLIYLKEITFFGSKLVTFPQIEGFKRAEISNCSSLFISEWYYIAASLSFKLQTNHFTRKKKV